MEAEFAQVAGTDLILPSKYRNALTASVSLHLLLLLGFVIVPAIRRPKKLIDPNQVLMAELVELEPPAPKEPVEPAPGRASFSASATFGPHGSMGCW